MTSQFILFGIGGLFIALGIVIMMWTPDFCGLSYCESPTYQAWMKMKGREVRPEDVETARKEVRSHARFRGLVFVFMGVLLILAALGFQKP